MKKILILLLLGVAAFWATAQNLPEKTNPPRIVNDFANLLTPQEQSMLERKLRSYNDTTSTQIAIVTVASLDGYDASEYAFALGRKWGVGEKGKNNGVLILIKPKVGNERGQIYIATGYGMEGAVTDAQTNRIVDQILIPAFQKNQYYQGLDAATTRIIQLASGEYKADKKGGAGEVSPITSLIIFGVILLAFMGIAAVARSKRFAGGQSSVYSSQGYRKQNAASSLPFWLLMMGLGSSMGNRGSNSSWNDFSGGGGGGFGGFGGGDFGGGGAGGSW